MIQLCEYLNENDSTIVVPASSLLVTMAPLEKNWPATWPYYDDAQYTFITGLFTVFGFGATLVGYVIPEKWQTWLQLYTSCCIS